MRRLSTLASIAALLGCAPGVEYEPRDFVCPAGEEPPCETSELARPGGWVGRGPRGELDSETRRYVLSWISIPQPEDGRIVGFNLDGVRGLDVVSDAVRETARCDERNEDYVGSLDRDHVGIDNVMGSRMVATFEGLIGSDLDLCPNGAAGCFDELLQASIGSEGSWLLLTLSDLDSLSYDPTVRLEIALGALPEGATLERSDDGRVAAGQRFEVTQVLTTTDADIFAGRLRSTGVEFPITWSIGDYAGDTYTLSPEQTEMRFSVEEDGLRAGALGGLLTVDDLYQPCLDCGGFDARAIIEGFADVQPGATDDDPCVFISMGAEFEAVPAR